MTGHWMDHEILGGAVTVFVLLYGDHHDLHVRCLKSILDNTPRHRIIELRIGMNAVCPETYEWIDRHVATQVSLALYDNGPENRMKYPMLREMIREPVPLWPYMVWFDDDSYVVDPQWLDRLAETIVKNHPNDCRLFGIPFKHRLGTEEARDWFRAGAWHRGRPNAEDRIDFVSGGFWAADVGTMLYGLIPDERLLHNGGDITIGEQVHQAGFKIYPFNQGKKYVFSSGAPRRGYSEQFPWRSSKK